MPDTAIFDALTGILHGEENVDSKEFKDWLEKIERKLDDAIKDGTAVDKRLVKVEADLNGLGQRIDAARVEIRDVAAKADASSGPGLKGWAAIISAVALGIASIIAAVHGSEKAADAAHAKEGK